MIGRAQSGRPRIRVAARRGVPFGTGGASPERSELP